MKNKFYFYTDGATEPTNPGPSSYAFVQMKSPHDKRELFSYSEYIGHSTNNIAELSAITAALKYIHRETDISSSDENLIIIYSDSQYAINCITKWYPVWLAKKKTGDKKNVDLIAKAWYYYTRIKAQSNISIEWVKGHSGVWGNERCDELCETQISKNNPTYVSGKSIAAARSKKKIVDKVMYTDEMLEGLINYIKYDPLMLDDCTSQEILNGYIDKLNN